EVVRINPRHEEALHELDALRLVPEQRARVVDILRPLYERADDWQQLIALNEDRFQLAELPGDKILVLRETAELWEARGGDRRKAMQVLAAAVRIDPEDDEVRHELERLAEGTGEWELVTDVYEEVLGARAGRDSAEAGASADDAQTEVSGPAA